MGDYLLRNGSRALCPRSSRRALIAGAVGAGAFGILTKSPTVRADGEYKPIKPIIALLRASEHQPPISYDDLDEMAAALQIQISRDLLPIWSLDAKVVAARSEDDVPSMSWVISIFDYDPCYPAGNHSVATSPPKASVYYQSDNWTRVVSHECLEMLANPLQNRYHLLPSLDPQKPDDFVFYPQEIVDPCESTFAGYKIGNISVSEFVTPYYFDMDTDSFKGATYSIHQQVTKPRGVLEGCTQNYMIQSTSEWWMATVTDGKTVVTKQGGSADCT
jgi:hypothetical protein